MIVSCWSHSKSPARSPYSQLIVSCTATTIITTASLFNYPHYCHGVKEGPAPCVFCSTIFTILGLFDDIVPVLIQCRLPSISEISKKLQCRLTYISGISKKVTVLPRFDEYPGGHLLVSSQAQGVTKRSSQRQETRRKDTVRLFLS